MKPQPPAQVSRRRDARTATVSTRPNPHRRSSAAQRSAVQCSAAQRSPAQSSAAQRSAVQRGPAQRSPAQQRSSAVQCSAAHRHSCDRIDGFESRRCAAPQRSLRLHAAQRCSVARRGTAGSRPIRTHGRFAVPVLGRRKPWRVLEQQRAAVGPVRDRRIVQRRRAVPAAQDATAACRAISRHPCARVSVGVGCAASGTTRCTVTGTHRSQSAVRYIELASRIRSV